MTFKKKIISQVVAVALCGTFAAAAQAAPQYISDGLGALGTEATIADAGYFENGGPGSVGLRYLGREFVNEGTFASNYWLETSAGIVGNAEETVVSAFGSVNPLGATAYPVTGDLEVNLGNGAATGWRFAQHVEVTAPGHVAVTVSLTNLTGSTATGVKWGVGIDPDQGIGGGGGFDTVNEIIGVGGASGIKATSFDGWSLTLQNTTSASAFSIAPYIDDSVFGACCTAIDPDDIFFNSQILGYTSSGDYSINLAYLIGDVANRQTVSFGYEYVMAVPEPETYAMLLAGLGLIGFSLRRRSA